MIVWSHSRFLKLSKLVISIRAQAQLRFTHLQYLYLLFDEDNSIHSDDSNYVFTTEGHIITLGPEHVRPVSAARRKLRGVDGHQCYKSSETGLVGGILSRPDVDYSRHLVALNASEKESYFSHPHGVCSRPKVELFVSACPLSRSIGLTPVPVV